MTQQLSVSTERMDGGIAIIHVVGELDAFTAPKLNDEINRLIDADAPGLVLDLLGVTFIGTAGLAVLIELHKESEVAYRVLATSHSILRALQVVGLTEDLHLADNLPDAVRQCTEQLGEDRPPER